jgi:hypothetical protein
MQLVLPHLPYDEATINVFLKWWFEYKSSYKLGNVHPNLVTLALKDLFLTPLYTNSNLMIHP